MSTDLKKINENDDVIESTKRNLLQENLGSCTQKRSMGIHHQRKPFCLQFMADLLLYIFCSRSTIDHLLVDNSAIPFLRPCSWSLSFVVPSKQIIRWTGCIGIQENHRKTQITRGKPMVPAISTRLYLSRLYDWRIGALVIQPPRIRVQIFYLDEDAIFVRRQKIYMAGRLSCPLVTHVQDFFIRTYSEHMRTVPEHVERHRSHFRSRKFAISFLKVKTQTIRVHIY